MEQNFEDAASFQAEVASRLAAYAPAELIQSLAGAVGQGEAAWRDAPRPAGATALNLRLGRYFIRDDDLPVIETIGTAASALAAAGGTAGIAWPALIPAITGIATLAWNLWRKGVRLSPDQLRLVGLLRRHGPSSAEVLLPLTGSVGVHVADKPAMEALLQGLAELETRDGTTISLIKTDAGGIWRAQAV